MRGQNAWWGGPNMIMFWGPIGPGPWKTDGNDVLSKSWPDEIESENMSVKILGANLLLRLNLERLNQGWINLQRENWNCKSFFCFSLGIEFSSHQVRHSVSCSILYDINVLSHTWKCAQISVFQMFRPYKHSTTQSKCVDDTVLNTFCSGIISCQH